MFSLINGVLLRPLPYPRPHELVTLWERNPQRGIEQERVSGPNYLDWRRQSTRFADLAASAGWVGSDLFNLVLRDGLVKVRASYTSASLFTTLGTKPLLGRPLQPEEDRRQGNRAAVLGYGLWQRCFGGDSNVIGRTLTLDSYGRRDYTIVGVMPPGFGVPSTCELWLPFGWMGVTLEERRSAHWHNVVARLKPGVTLAEARAELTVIQQRLHQMYPQEAIGSEVAVVPLLEQALGRNLRKALLVLWGVVAGVLCIACANVANLMLARVAARQKEIALRLALGAGRWRVVRQLLAESVLLALLGGGIGVVLGWYALHVFVTAGPADIPRLREVSLDGVALSFTLGLSVATGVLFGLAPAWLFSRPDLNTVLRDGSPTASASAAAARTRSALVVAEVGLSVVLLAGAALMLEGFARMLCVERGLQPERLLTVGLDFSVSGFTTWVRPTATRPQVPLLALLEQLRALPGVRQVGAGSRLLRRENRPPVEPIAILGRPAGPAGEPPRAEFTGITPGWVGALGARLVRGRDLAESDALEAPGAVLINETLARRYFPNQDPVGQRLKMGDKDAAPNATNVWGLSGWSEIVGVVSDVKSLHPQPQAVPEVYQSYWQYPMQSPTVLVRALEDAATLVPAIQRAVKAAIPALPPPVVRSMDNLISESVAQPRLQTGLLSSFALVALALAAIGLYGLLAFAVAQRQRELGIRLALGAQRRQVFSLVIGQGLRLALTGITLGTLAALALTRVVQSLVYDAQPANPLAFMAVALILIGVAMLASWLPARRATRVDPIVALRCD
jgi:putative ABC transport system permease protein